MKKNLKKGFTLVELVVVATILVILGTIGFSAFVGHISESRDAQRKSDFTQIGASMKLFKREKGILPMPDTYFNITNGGTGVVLQGKLSGNVGLSTIDIIPMDPKLKIPYIFSITTNKQEFQIAGSLENSGKAISLLSGNYKSVAKTVLPTLIIAMTSTSDIEIRDGTGDGSENRKTFIFDKQSHNLPYDFDGHLTPISDGTDFDTLLEEAENNKLFVQNSSYETCDEIKDDGKSIGDGTYQVRTETGSLTNTGCTDM